MKRSNKPAFGASAEGTDAGGVVVVVGTGGSVVVGDGDGWIFFSASFFTFVDDD